MTRKNDALDYFACTVPELQAFLESRTGNRNGDGAPIRSQKAYYVNALRGLDRHAQFRFLDLAPELRNLVYQELLTWADVKTNGEGSCWPQILATSSQVYREAKDIIYADNAAHVALDVLLSEPEAGYLTVGSAHRHLGPQQTPIRHYSNFRWPAYLQRFHRIVVTVDVQGIQFMDSIGSRTFEYGGIMINSLLYCLSCQLVESTSLDHLDLRIKDAHQTVRVEDVPQIVWPLTKLGLPPSCISISGLPGDASVYYKAQEEGIKQTPLNVLSRYRSLADRADKFSILSNALPAARLYRRQGSHWLDMLVNDLHNAVPGTSYMSQAREDQLLNCIEELDEWLQGNAVQDLEKALEAAVLGIRGR